VRFLFDEDSLLLQSTLRDFLAGECPPETVRALFESETGRSRELWKKLAETGVAGLLAPEESEGMGLDERAMVLLQEEAGRAGLAEPVISTAAVGVPLLVELQVKELSDSWLKRAAVGDAVIAVGHPVSRFVSDAHVADLLLLAHGEELHAVPPDAVRATHEPTNDPARRIFSIEWTPRAETCVAEAARARTLLDAALDRGALAAAGQAIGVADRLLQLAVDYASERKQFGQPIGSFQAVKHMLASAKVRLEYARPLVHRAAASVATGSPWRPVHVSMAKSQACEAAELAARVALQTHGAIGYTWEQDVHIWMRRAWSLSRFFGSATFHRDRVADAVLAEGAPIGPGTTFAGEQ